MEANLVYIHEDEIRTDFQQKLSQLKDSDLPVFVIVQMKLLPLELKPLLNDIEELRIDKVKNKTNEWLQSYFKKSSSLVVKFIGENPNNISSFFDFSKIKKLFVYGSKKEQKKISTLLKDIITPVETEWVYL